MTSQPDTEQRPRMRLHHEPEITAKALFERARRLDQVAGFGYEMADFLTDLVPFLAALQKQEAVPVAWQKTYELTLADQKEARSAAEWRGSNGQWPYLDDLRHHPLAKAELGSPRGYDHIHLSQIDGTDFVIWMGRAASGYHYPIGRYMKLVRSLSPRTSHDHS